MINFKLADIQNLKTTIEKRQGYKSFSTKFGSEKFMVGRLIDWKNKSPLNGNFEAATPQKGVKKDDWEWKVENYSSETWQEKYSWKVDVDGEGEGYIDLNEYQNGALMSAIEGITEDQVAIIKVKKEARTAKNGKAYSAYVFILEKGCEPAVVEDLEF